MKKVLINLLAILGRTMVLYFSTEKVRLPARVRECILFLYLEFWTDLPTPWGIRFLASM